MTQKPDDGSNQLALYEERARTARVKVEAFLLATAKQQTVLFKFPGAENRAWPRRRSIVLFVLPGLRVVPLEVLEIHRRLNREPFSRHQQLAGMLGYHRCE